MGVTVKKCHMIMSGNDCWNSVCFSCCRKADNELADVTLSGSLFQNCAAGTGNARPPMVHSLNGGTRGWNTFCLNENVTKTCSRPT